MASPAPSPIPPANPWSYPVQWFVPVPPSAVPPRPPQIQKYLAIERLRHAAGYYRAFLISLAVVTAAGGLSSLYSGTAPYLGLSPLPLTTGCFGNSSILPGWATAGPQPGYLGLQAVVAVGFIAALIFALISFVDWRRGAVDLRAASDPYGIDPTTDARRSVFQVDAAIWTLLLFAIFIIVFGLTLSGVFASQVSATCPPNRSLQATLVPYTQLVAASAGVTAVFFLLVNGFLLGSIRAASRHLGREDPAGMHPPAAGVTYVGSALLGLGALCLLAPYLSILESVGFAVMALGSTLVVQWLDRLLVAIAPGSPASPQARAGLTP